MIVSSEGLSHKHICIHSPQTPLPSRLPHNTEYRLVCYIRVLYRRSLLVIHFKSSIVYKQPYICSPSLWVLIQGISKETKWMVGASYNPMSESWELPVRADISFRCQAQSIFTWSEGKWWQSDSPDLQFECLMISCMLVAHQIFLNGPDNNKHKEDCLNMRYCGNFSEVYIKSFSL